MDKAIDAGTNTDPTAETIVAGVFRPRSLGVDKAIDAGINTGATNRIMPGPTNNWNPASIQS